MRDLMVTDSNFDFHPRRHMLAQHFCHLTDRIHPFRWSLANFSQHHLAVAGSTLWIKLLASFALSRHAHGIAPAKKKAAKKSGKNSKKNKKAKKKSKMQ